MPLERIDSEIAREAHGFSFSMRVAGSQQTVRVFVSDDALDPDTPLDDENELRAQLDAERQALEAVASDKYCHGQVAADGVVAINLSDVVRFIE
jgi:hypothetical protein